MRVISHIFFLSSILLALGAVAAPKALNPSYAVMYMMASLSIHALLKYQSQLMTTDYYGTDHDFWKHASMAERHEMRKFYWAGQVRGHVKHMLNTTRKGDVKLKWMLHKMDQRFG